MQELAQETGPLLGIDYGRRRIGVALADGLGISIDPLGFVPREHDHQAAQLVAALAQQHRVAKFIVGRPVHANGDAGANVAWVEDFCMALRKYSQVPQTLVDERYTSAEAERILRERGEWPAPPGRLDAVAAMVILRRYLNGEAEAE